MPTSSPQQVTAGGPSPPEQFQLLGDRLSLIAYSNLIPSDLIRVLRFLHKKMSGFPNSVNYIRELTTSLGIPITARSSAEKLDEIDELSSVRKEFHYPKKRSLPAGNACDLDPVLLSVGDHDILPSAITWNLGVIMDFVCFSGAQGKDFDKDEEIVYMCGNSLGLQPKNISKLINRELDKWAAMGVNGYFQGNYPWLTIAETAVEKIADVIGAKRIEVAIMNSLTVNLHFLMVPFYRPTDSRHKILIENRAFPSDHYAVESQIRFHGYDPKDSLILAKTREGEDTIRTEDIVDIIEKEGDSIALVMFSGIQYYTGQCFDMKAITEAGHKKGCIVGFDLAHAVGNVILKLHDWDVDFACWCTYKYLNSGPGCIGGAFVHERHAYNFDLPKFTGRWGHEVSTRFVMDNNFKQIPGAGGYQLSNPGVMATMCLIGSLQIFERVGMEKIRKKSLALTGYLEALLMEQFFVEGREYVPEEVLLSKTKKLAAGELHKIRILTPADPERRGCQLSLRFMVPIDQLVEELEKRGVVCRAKKPDIIRVAPAPLYNSFKDVWTFVEALKESLDSFAHKTSVNES